MIHFRCDRFRGCPVINAREMLMEVVAVSTTVCEQSGSGAAQWLWWAQPE